MNKKIILTTAAFALLIPAATITAGKISANQNGTDNHNAMIEKLAEKFNLDQNELFEFFKTQRQQNQEQKQQERQAEFEAGLDKAVADGVITSNQKQKLLEKRQENKEDRQQNRELMQQFLEELGINHDDLKPYIGGPRGSFKGPQGK